MLRNIKSLTIQDQTSRNELLIVLKEEAKKFTLQDIISCSLQIQQEADCIHTNYKKEYIKAETGFMIRIVEVKDDNFNYNGPVEVDELNTAINILEEQEKMMEDMEDTNPVSYTHLTLPTILLV